MVVLLHFTDGGTEVLSGEAGLTVRRWRGRSWDFLKGGPATELWQGLWT